MSIQKVYIDVIWKPGRVFFAKRTPKIITDGNVDRAASTLRSNIALQSEQTIGVNARQLESELYFEVYDCLDGEKPIHKSQNAP